MGKQTVLAAALQSKDLGLSGVPPQSSQAHLSYHV